MDGLFYGLIIIPVNFNCLLLVFYFFSLRCLISSLQRKFLENQSELICWFLVDYLFISGNKKMAYFSFLRLIMVFLKAKKEGLNSSFWFCQDIFYTFTTSFRDDKDI